MPSLQRELPGINYNFIHGLSREMTERVISWEADFGIVVNPIKHPDLVIKKLCQDEVTIFSARGSQDRLIYDQNLAQSQHILKKISRKRAFGGQIKTGNLEIVAKLSALGLGFGLLPTRVAAHYSKLQRLEGAPLFRDEICLIYRPEKHNNPASRKIISIIKSAEI
jgi:DNA-binding transcriptional LysR family regulator